MAKTINKKEITEKFVQHYGEEPKAKNFSVVQGNMKGSIYNGWKWWALCLEHGFGSKRKSDRFNDLRLCRYYDSLLPKVIIVSVLFLCGVIFLTVV